jgi:hypothetical protein
MLPTQAGFVPYPGILYTFIGQGSFSWLFEAVKFLVLNTFRIHFWHDNVFGFDWIRRVWLWKVTSQRNRKSNSKGLVWRHFEIYRYRQVTWPVATVTKQYGSGGVTVTIKRRYHVKNCTVVDRTCYFFFVLDMKARKCNTQAFTTHLFFHTSLFLFKAIQLISRHVRSLESLRLN